MGFWPDVKRGDKVQHHMVLENNLRHMVNSLNGFGSGTGRATPSGVVRIQIWNATNETLPAGQPVAFDNTKPLCGDAVPAVKVTDTKKPWGVCVNTLDANSMGDCIISGPAVVTLTGGSGDYAEPVVNGTGFTRSSNGTARVLFTGDKNIIVLGGAASTEYDGMFKLVVETVTEGEGESETTHYYARVVDGAFYSSADFDPEDSCGTVGFDGQVYEVISAEVEVESGDQLYFYVVKTENGFEVFYSEYRLGYSQYTPNILIGRLGFSGAEPLISQDHLTGAINLESPYTGMFSVEVFADEDNGEIVYDYMVYGGDAYANMTHFSVEDLDIAEVQNGTTYIYFSVEYDTSDYTFQNGDIAAYRSSQADTQYQKYVLIATINRSNGYVTVNQHQYGAVRVFFWGECEHGEE